MKRHIIKSMREKTKKNFLKKGKGKTSGSHMGENSTGNY